MIPHSLSVECGRPPAVGGKLERKVDLLEEGAVPSYNFGKQQHGGRRDDYS